jgi:hypothetical protein
MADNDPYACPTVPQLLSVLEAGDFSAAASDALNRLISDMENAALEAGTQQKIKGALTLKINLTLHGGVYQVTGEHKETSPRRPAGATVMYATANNVLSRQAPRQPDMFLSEADKPRQISTIV